MAFALLLPCLSTPIALGEGLPEPDDARQDRAPAAIGECPHFLIARLGSFKLRHPYGLRGLATSSDGARIASWGDDGCLRVWNATSGDLEWVHPIRLGRPTCATFLAGGKTLAFGDSTGGVQVVDLVTRTVVARPVADTIVIRGLCHLAQQRQLVVAKDDGKILILDCDTWNTVRERDLAIGVFECTSTNSGKLIGVAGDREIIILRSGDLTQVFRRDLGSPGSSVAIAEDDDTCAYGCLDGSISVVSLGASTVETIPDAHKGYVYSVFFADSNHLVSSGLDGRVRVLDPKTRAEIRTIPHPMPGLPVQLASSGTAGKVWVGSVTGNIQLLDLSSGELADREVGWRSALSSVCFDHDGRRLASTDRYSLAIWDLASGKLTARKPLPDGLRSAVFADANPARILVTQADGGVWMIESESDTPLKELFRSEPPFAQSPSAGASGKIAFGSGSHASILETADPFGCVSLDLGRTMISKITLDPRGTRLAVADQAARQIEVWDIARRSKIASLPISIEPVVECLFLGQAEVLAILTDRGDLTFWDWRSGSLWFIRVHCGVRTTFATTPDGEWLAAGCRNGSVEIWDLKTRRLEELLIAHLEDISCLQFDPGVERLASGSRDGTIAIWDFKTIRANSRR